MKSPATADKVVILDRDGTIVVDRGYLSDPSKLEFEPGAAEGLKWLYSHGYRLIVITNQSGIGRGLFTLEQLEAMDDRLNAMVAEAGARLEAIYSCPHTPEAGCSCRKPALGLLACAISELRFDPASAVMIGDKESDIEFGRRGGARTILIHPGEPAAAAARADVVVRANVVVRPDVVARDLMEAARAITSRAGASSGDL